MRAAPVFLSRRARDAGFTLIEVMLALAILTFVTAIMWGTFSQTAADKRALESAQERTHTVRVALMRMTRELEMAYLSGSENTAISERRTFFVGSAHGDVDEMQFSNFAHQRLRAGLAEGDTALISYFGERDPDDRRSVLVELTDKGVEKHEEAMAIQGPKEALLADALSEREKEQLNSLLRRVMITLEERYPGKHD